MLLCLAVWGQYVWPAKTRHLLCVCRYLQPGGQGSVVTSGDEAVVWRACHQQQVDEHSLGYVVRVTPRVGG